MTQIAKKPRRRAVHRVRLTDAEGRIYEGRLLVTVPAKSAAGKLPHKFPYLEERIRATPPKNIYISIVTAEEMLRGAFDLIRQEDWTLENLP